MGLLLKVYAKSGKLSNSFQFPFCENAAILSLNHRTPLRLKTHRLCDGVLRVGVEYLQRFEILHPGLRYIFRIAGGARFLELLKTHCQIAIRIFKDFPVGFRNH